MSLNNIAHLLVSVLTFVCQLGRYLLEHNAFPASVNNEGQTPADLAEEHGSNGDCQTPTDLIEDYNKIVELLNTEIERLGKHMEAALQRALLITVSCVQIWT